MLLSPLLPSRIRAASARVALFACLAVVSCKSSPATPVAPGAGSGVLADQADDSAAQLAGVPADTSELWSFAPEHATTGVVITGLGVQQLAHVLVEGRRLLGERPGGRLLLDKLQAELHEVPFDVFDIAAWSRLGMTSERGGGLFIIDTGDNESGDDTGDNQSGVDTGDNKSSDDTLGLIVLSVHDREAFRRLSETKPSLERGREVDRSDDLVCMTVRERYACADSMDLLLAAERASTGKLATTAAQLSQEGRGDVEFIMDLSRDPDIMESSDLRTVLTPTGMVALTARMNRGSARLWFWMQGTAADSPMLETLVAHDATPSATSLWIGADDLVRLHLPIDGLLSASGVPSTLPVGNGADLRRDLMANLTGEITGFSAGGGLFDYHVLAPLNQPDAARRAVVGICQDMAPMVTTIKGVRPLQITRSGCSTVVDLDASWLGMETFEELAAEYSQVPVALWVNDEGVFALDIGGLGDPLRNRARTLGSEGSRELAEGAWHAVMWGLHFDPYAVVPEALMKLVDGYADDLDAESAQYLDLFRWLAGHLYDVGGGAVIRADGLYLIAQATTFAADPKPAYQAYERALVHLLDGAAGGDGGGPRGYRADMAKISSQFSTSLAGRHGKELLDEVSLIGQLDTFFLYMSIVQAMGDNSDGP